jgi:formylglycine-generating enzyme required for sulfatase activity
VSASRRSRVQNEKAYPLGALAKDHYDWLTKLDFESFQASHLDEALATVHGRVWEWLARDL